MHLSLNHPFWALLFVIGIVITLASCGGNSSGPDLNKLEIISITPDSGMVGNAITVKNSGGPHTSPDNTLFTFNDIEAEILRNLPEKLIVTVPEDATSGRVKLEVDGHTVTGPHFTVLNFDPKITSVSPAKAIPGTKITIQGKYFLPGDTSNSEDNSKDLLPSVPKKERSPTVYNSKSSSLPKNPKAALSSVSQTTQAKKNTDTRNNSAPTLSSQKKKGSSVSQSTTANDSTDRVAISFGDQQAEIESISDTLLVTTVPEDASGGPITITVGNKSVSWDYFEVFPALKISAIKPENGPPGTSVTLTGDGFSTTIDSNAVTFNETQAVVSNASTTELTAVVPENASSGPVEVQTNGQTATGPEFSVTAPSTEITITEITPSSGDSGSEVTIRGQNFSNEKDENTVTFNGTEATVTSASTTKLTTQVPSEATSGPIYVTVDGKTTTGPDFTVTDKSQNSAPEFTSSASLSVQENTKAIDTITASDPEGDAISYILTGGDDQDQFEIDGQTGALAFTSTPDYENPSDTNADNVYEVQVSASDGSLSTSQDITVTVTDVNENQAPSFTNNSSLTINENDTVVDVLTASDPEGDAITLSLSGGTDQDLFNLEEQSGELSFKTAPDHEDPADANSDNIYEVQVEAADNSGSTSQNIVVEVLNLNDNSPVITKSEYEIEENSTEVGVIEATDPDDDELTYELNGGADEKRFELDSQTGALSFKNPPDYEQPLDGEYMTNGFRDNEYEVGILVRDGENIDLSSLGVKVLNVAEPPLIDRGQIIAGGNQIYRTDTSTDPYLFDPVPVGTDLADYLSVDIYFEPESEEVTEVSISGTDADLFGVEQIRRSSISEQYYAIINGPSSLDYNHNAEHQYEFTVTASTDAGDDITATFVLPISPFDGGSGTASDPYLVSTLNQLQAVDMFRAAHFRQSSNINASETTNWNGGAGFTPIATQDNPFTGSYDGAGYTISGLTVNVGKSERYYGLFEAIGKNGSLKKVRLLSVDFRVPYGGVLAGLNEGTIENSSITGSLQGSQGGGLVFVNQGTITESNSEVTVEMSGGGPFTVAGGLVGTNYGTINNSRATGRVEGQAMTGGLVGWNSGGIVTHSHATGNVRGEGFNNGGLVAVNDIDGQILYSYASGDVGDFSGANAAGLVSRNNALIQESFSFGFVSVEGLGGGLVAENDENGIIRNSFSVSKLESTSGSSEAISFTLGGLVGQNKGKVSTSWTLGDMTVYSSDTYGALIGENDSGTVTNSYYNKNISVPTSDGGMGLTSEQMTGSSAPNYMNLNFDTIWQQGEANNLYPTLRNISSDWVIEDPDM